MAKKKKESRVPLVDYHFYTVVKWYGKLKCLYGNNYEMLNRDTVWRNYLNDYFKKNYTVTNN